jgi:hypothetical protein
MTGRDLILYILQNNLEDEPVYKDGTFIGFVPVHEAAAKIGVGSATIFALVGQDKLDYISVGGIHYISAMNNFKKKGE